MVITVKNFNNKIMLFSASDDYNFEATPSMLTYIIFIDQRWKKSKYILYLSKFKVDNSHTIHYLESMVENLDGLCKIIFDWHKENHGIEVKARQFCNDVPCLSKELVVQLIESTYQD